MKITVANPRNSFFLTFYDDLEFRRKYGIRTFREKGAIAVRDRAYEIYARGLSGLYALPQSTMYSQHGYRQDGSDYQYNDYQDRIITFEFPQHYGATITQQVQVLNQSQHMLDIAITTDNATHNIKGHLNGTSEFGIMEFDCPTPFFTTNRRISRNELISINPHDRRLLPMFLPETFFGGAALAGNIVFDALFPTNFIIKLTGIFDGITINALNVGASITYSGAVRDTMIIDTYDNTVLVDAQNVTQEVSGLFPSLIEGRNVFEFNIPEGGQHTDVKLLMEYQEVVGAVE